MVFLIHIYNDMNHFMSSDCKNNLFIDIFKVLQCKPTLMYTYVWRILCASFIISHWIAWYTKLLPIFACNLPIHLMNTHRSYCIHYLLSQLWLLLFWRVLLHHRRFLVGNLNLTWDHFSSIVCILWAQINVLHRAENVNDVQFRVEFGSQTVCDYITRNCSDERLVFFLHNHTMH